MGFLGHFRVFYHPSHTLTTKLCFLPDHMQVEMKVRFDSSFLKSYFLLLLWAHYWNSRHSSPFKELMRVILNSWNILMVYLLFRNIFPRSPKQLCSITQLGSSLLCCFAKWLHSITWHSCVLLCLCAKSAYLKVHMVLVKVTPDCLQPQ